MNKKNLSAGAIERKHLYLIAAVILAGVAVFVWKNRPEGPFEPKIIDENARQQILLEISKENTTVLPEAERQKVMELIQK